MNELTELGYDGAEGFAGAIEDIIKSSDVIDGTALLAGAENFIGKGKGDGEAYINALSEYISTAEIPWKWSTEPYPTPSSYAPPAVIVGPQTMEQTLKIHLNVDGVDMGTKSFKTNDPSTINVEWNDATMSNGMGK